MKQYRAWYTGDNPPLLFEMVYKPDDELYFRMAEDHEIRYDFKVPFIDTDWIVEEGIGLFSDNKEIFQGDVDKKHGEIKYWKGSFGFDKDGQHDFLPVFEVWVRGKLEIIGNIHQKEKI